MLAQPGVVNNPTLNGQDTFGTMSTPQITHFTGNLTIGMHGGMDGAGILIVDGGLTINGDVTFDGIIIVRGTTQISTVSGHATIFGALWTTDLSLTVGGNAGVFYSSQALALTTLIPNASQYITPRRVNVVAWTNS